LLGVYGVELGAYVAFKATEYDGEIKVLALDSIPRSSDELVSAAVRSDIGFDSALVQRLSITALRLYLLRSYESSDVCSLARSFRDQKVLLLSGTDAGYLRDSTMSVGQCFPNKANVEVRADLPLSGFNLPLATGEEGEGYDRIVIDFFDRTLR